MKPWERDWGAAPAAPAAAAPKPWERDWSGTAAPAAPAAPPKPEPSLWGSVKVGAQGLKTLGGLVDYGVERATNALSGGNETFKRDRLATDVADLNAMPRDPHLQEAGQAYEQTPGFLPGVAAGAGVLARNPKSILHLLAESVATLPLGFGGGALATKAAMPIIEKTALGIGTKAALKTGAFGAGMNTAMTAANAGANTGAQVQAGLPLDEAARRGVIQTAGQLPGAAASGAALGFMPFKGAGIKPALGNIGTQTAIQSAGQVASTVGGNAAIGQPTTPEELFTSAVGGAVMGPVDMAMAGLRGLYKSRGANVDNMTDEELVSSTLDGTHSDVIQPDEAAAILKQHGVDPAQFTDPAAAAARVQEARARRPASIGPNVNRTARNVTEVGRQVDKATAAELQRIHDHTTLETQRRMEHAALTERMLREGGEPPAPFVANPLPPRPARTVPDDATIIAMPEGNAISTDQGALQGVDRQRAGEQHIFDLATARANGDPVLAEILNSGLSRQLKIKALYERLSATPETPTERGGLRVNAPEGEDIQGFYSGRTRPPLRDPENPKMGVVNEPFSATEQTQRDSSPTQADLAAGRVYRDSKTGAWTADPGKGRDRWTARTQTGGSDRAFPTGGDDPAGAPGFWEERSRQQHEEAKAKAQADLEAKWEARKKADEEMRAREKARAEQAKARGEEFTGNPDADAQTRYKGKYSQKPHQAGDFWNMTQEGHVAGEDGSPVAFRNARAAAKWAVDNKLAGDFEIHAYGTNTERVTLRRRPNSTYGERPPTPDGPADPAAGRSTDTSQRAIGGTVEPTPTPKEAPKAEAPPVAPKPAPASDSLPPMESVAPKPSDKPAEARNRGSITRMPAGRTVKEHRMQGWNAARDGWDINDNPYIPTSTISDAWRAGFRSVKSQADAPPVKGGAAQGDAPPAAPYTPPPTAEPAPRPEIPASSRQPVQTGKKSQVVTTRGRSVDTEFEVHEAADLVGSDHPAYDPTIQPRDRAGRSTSDTQISKIAGNLDPMQLSDSRQAGQGAPIIGPDRMVESGNGRVSAIRTAYGQYPERAAAYRKHIEDMGFDTTGFNEPVLVRKRTTPMDAAERQAWTREANERDTMSMSSAEQATADAKAMGDATVDLYRGGPVTAAGNREFVRAFMRDVVGPGDANSMVGPDGAISLDGVRRVNAALLSKAYDAPDLIARIVEDTDTNIKAIGTALTDAAPAMAQLRAAIARGDIPKELDIAPHVSEAARLISKARDEGRKVSDIIAQTDAFAPRVDPKVEAILRLMYRDDAMTKPRAGAKLAEALRYYAEEAGKANDGPGLFGDEAPPVKSGDILDAARSKADGPATAEQADIFSRPSARESDPTSSAGEPGTQRPDGDSRQTGPTEGQRRFADDVAAADAFDRAAAGEPWPDDMGDKSQKIRNAWRDGAETRNNGNGFTTHSNPMFDPEMWKKAAKLAVDPDVLRGDMTAMKEAIKNPAAMLKAAASPLGHITSFMFSNDGAGRVLAERFNAPSIHELMDHYTARSGMAGPTRALHEAVGLKQKNEVQAVFDLLEPHMADPAAMQRIRDILALPNGRHNAKPSEFAAAKAIAKQLKDFLEYRKDAGVDIGEVTDGYFPRVISPDLAAAKQEQFTAAATKLYQGIGVKDARGAAEAWFNRLYDTYAGLDGALAHGIEGLSGSDSAKSRKFGKEADVLLKDFYEPDVFQTLANYFSGGAKHAEETRRFGIKGRVGSPERAAWTEAHGIKDERGTKQPITQHDEIMARIRAEMLASGEDPNGAMHTLQNIHRANLGQLGSHNPRTRHIVANINAYTQLRNLPKVVITSLGELTMGIIRGGAKEGVPYIGQSLKNVARIIAKAAPDDAARWAMRYGINAEAATDLLSLRGGQQQAGVATRRMMANYFKAVGIHQWTQGQRIAAATMHRNLLKTFAEDLLLSKSARTRSRAELYLKEYGIQDPKTFAERMLTDGEPTDAEHLADKGFANEYTTAIVRGINQTQLAANRGEIPFYASHPLGSMLFSLQNYSYAFKKNVLDRAWRLGKQGISNRDPHLLLPAMSLALMIGTTEAIDTYLKPWIYGSNYDFENETPAKHALRLIDRSGGTAGASPAVNAFTGVRFGRSVLESAAGPFLGQIGQGLQVGVNVVTNTADTNTAKRNAYAMLYDSVIWPGTAALASTRLAAGVARSGTIAAATPSKPSGAKWDPKGHFVDWAAGPEDF